LASIWSITSSRRSRAGQAGGRVYRIDGSQARGNDRRSAYETCAGSASNRRGAYGLCVNRRNNREADVAALLAKGEPLKGPVDPAVPVMTVTRPDKSVVAILFGYACHPTTLSFTKWCGDYHRFRPESPLRRTTPAPLAMFVNTCGGDQNPLPRRTVELCENVRPDARGRRGASAEASR